MHADLQRLLADETLSDIKTKTMERLRGIRVEMTEAESDVSFVRRVAQGRLDIVGHEVDRRAGGGDSAAGANPAAGDVSALLFEMPNILSDAAGGSPPAGGGQGPRPGLSATVLEPGPLALSLVDDLNAIADPPTLSGVEGLSESELADLFGGLRELEVELSSTRRLLHERIDQIQDEIARRYRDGEASVDSLLR